MSFAYLKMNEAQRHWHTVGLQFLFPSLSPGSESPVCSADNLTADREPQSNNSAASNLNSQSVHSQTLSSAIFEQLYAKITVPCFSVWTYWELGADLLTTPNQDRRTALAALLRELGWPKGSISFWPIGIPSDESTVAYPEAFWHVVDTMLPKLIVIFGKRSLEALTRGTPYELFHCEGKSPVLLALPDILDVHPDNKLYFRRTCETLRELRHSAR